MPPSHPDIPNEMTGTAAFAAPPSHASGDVLTPGKFAELFEASSRTLWCIAVSILRERELARDIVQESAIIGMRKISEFEPSTSFTAWMGQIVRYTALNEARRRTRRRENAGPDAADQSPSPASSSPDPAMGVGVAGFDEHVTAALNELEETPRACLLMKIILGLEYKDISEALGIPEGTAMSHVFRARKLLRSRLAATHGPETDTGSARDPETSTGTPSGGRRARQ
ncbi:MAG: RNA polymerase sigma factor [Phycisphaerales bacterium]|nr:RNA polymerase sigma factor [Phycisphaerales bacterium]